jgi:hypothetical protein
MEIIAAGELFFSKKKILRHKNGAVNKVANI